ncbi:hypothetical protein HaLaN_07397 [Haematococcus lacustris]|uniref:Uncharacterized protein n=1 Tax=Haematococcus lacustris TaxID=44745 RepID=A0A699YPD0_HAELA|nr:hypothetical protein HaLaN_07397 [Haematococcus lacustris]
MSLTVDWLTASFFFCAGIADGRLVHLARLGLRGGGFRGDGRGFACSAKVPGWPCSANDSAGPATSETAGRAAAALARLAAPGAERLA